MSRVLLPSLAALLLPSAFSPAPPVFRDLAYEDALEHARKSGRLLIVDATAAWCAPCKRMDQTTWIDPVVVEWIDEHAIAIQFDVDDQPELARRLRTHALPTIIAFRDGHELDRVVGYRTASRLIEWLDALRDGRTSLDALREQAMRKNWRDRYDIRARMQYADALRYAGKFEQALDEYRWLWDHMLEHQASMSAVRRSFLASSIRNLIAEYEPARAGFRELRDRDEARLREHPDWDTLLDWLTLNEIIDDTDATLAWVDRIRRDDEGLATLRRVEHAIRQTLLDRGRYDIVGHLVEDPFAAFERDRAVMHASGTSPIAPAMSAGTRRSMRETSRRLFADRVAVLHAGLLAAGRADEAWDIFERALWEEDSAVMSLALARRAFDAGTLTGRHLALLDPRIDTHRELLDDIRESDANDDADTRR